MSFFVVRATNRHGKHVYLATDAASGGYPYWTKFIGNAEFADTPEKLTEWLTNSYAVLNVTDMKIVEFVEKEIQE